MAKLVHMAPDSIVPLANAIIASAARDYMNAVAKQDAEEIMKNENFFSSDWFDELCWGLDGRSLAKDLKKKVLKYVKMVQQHQPGIWKCEAEEDLCSFTCPICRGKVNVFWFDNGESKRRRGDDKMVIHRCNGCMFEVKSVFGIGPAINHICYNCKHYFKDRFFKRCDITGAEVNYDMKCPGWEEKDEKTD